MRLIARLTQVPRASVLGRLLRFPVDLVPRSARLPILTGPLKGAKWAVGSCNRSCWLGIYEHEKARLVQQLVKPGSVFVDIGANAGYFSLLASRLVGPTGAVVAFEPMAKNLMYLHEHLRLNDVSNVQVVPAAVCEQDGEAVFDEAPGPLGARLAATGGSTVRTVALDPCVGRGEVPLPDFVKIDAEGAELRILTGARSILQGAAPTLFIDTHSDILERECCDFLLGLGYELHAIDGLGP